MCVKHLEQFLNIDLLELVFEAQCDGLAKGDFLPCAIHSFVVTFVLIDILEEYQVLRKQVGTVQFELVFLFPCLANLEVENVASIFPNAWLLNTTRNSNALPYIIVREIHYKILLTFVKETNIQDVRGLAL